MSRQRNEMLPGAGLWDSFYDKQIQELLEPERLAASSQATLTGETRLEFLAWPIEAYLATGSLVVDYPGKVERNEVFLWAYWEHPILIAALFQTLTEYHNAPDREKSLCRRMAEIHNFAPAGDHDGQTCGETPSLLDWKTIAEMLGCRNSPSQLKTEFHREKKRRLALEQKWSANFAARSRLDEIRRQRGELILPLQFVKVRD